MNGDEGAVESPSNRNHSIYVSALPISFGLPGVTADIHGNGVVDHLRGYCLWDWSVPSAARQEVDRDLAG